MVPPSIRSNLAALRRRERLLTFVWGLACWLAIAVVLLLFACFVDWFIDRDRDTPMAVRVALVIVQLAVWVIAGFWFIIWPQIRRLPDETLALWVEELMRFDHRLISAVQFNQPHADLTGMSKELVALVTREAEREAQRVGFAQVADHRRLGWGVGLVVPVLIIFALPFLIFPNVSFTLLARQTLADIEIPRSVQLASISPVVWVQNETIPIRFRVTGHYSEDMVGRLTVMPQGEETDRFDLIFIKEDADGAIFGADVPTDSSRITGYSVVSIRYTARVGDGRTRLSSAMRLVPRPTVIANQAWVILPAYCGIRPDRQRYERPQGDGEVAGIHGSGVRVQFDVQRPLKRAWLELRGLEFDPKRLQEETELLEVKKAELPMRVARKVDPETKQPIDVWTAETTFDLTEGLTAYVMCVEDEDGFDNNPKKRRTLRLVPEEAPQVALLKDTFDLGEGSTFDLEGLPIVLGRPIRIPYECRGSYGLSSARILFRLVPKRESGNEEAKEEPWSMLDLPEFQPKADPGPFNLKAGVFANMTYKDQISFYLLPSPNPDRELGRTIGGGRYFLQTKDDALFDGKGKQIKLKAGDQIEYCVEVFASVRAPKSSIPSARSESRVATMMSQREFENWLSQVSQEDERVRQLELRQKGIFERK